MIQQEKPVTEQSTHVPAVIRALGRLIEMGSDPKLRLIALLLAGLIAWIVVILNFPLEVAIPRYADF